MQPIYLSIQQEETGAQIRKLMMKNGYTVRDVQGAMGFENPQAVYKWISGKSLPSLDNFLILSRLLHASIEDILVVDGDIVMSALFETIDLVAVPYRRYMGYRTTDFQKARLYGHSHSCPVCR